MDGREVADVLAEKDITHLHHANSVETSCTFLKVGGLASRGYVEENGLRQTSQYTDELDKRFGIWRDVFTDSVDIHDRASTFNKYGPVLFLLDASVLRSLPPRSEVLVTRKNPTKWENGEAEDRRWFLDIGSLRAGLSRGTFDQMIVIRTETGMLPFQGGSARIILDDPKRELSQGTKAFEHARDRLKRCAAKQSVTISLNARRCGSHCKCIERYAGNHNFESHFK